MAAEIIEQAELNTETEGLSELPQDPQALPQEDLVQELSGPDSLDPEPDDDDLPDKYRGKSLKEVARMHQEAERALGRQGSEVGELRSVVDKYIVSQLSTNNEPEAPQEPDVDFFEDPDTAVNKAIERHPAVQQAQAQAQQYRKQTAMSQLQQRHPDMGQILGDQKFLEWVQASPVRVQLFQEADQNYNASVADELLTLYKERQEVAQQTAAVETQARKQQVRAAQTGTGGQANSGGSKRIYRRTDIIKLMKNDPDRYEALSDEIMQAYAEGRVR